MLLRFERIECCLLGRTELWKRQGIAQVEAAVQGAKLALEDSALDEGRKVGGLDVGTLGGEGRHGNPGVAVVFGLSLKGKLKVVDATRSEVFGPGDVFWETGESMTIESVGGSDAEMVIFEVGAKHP